MTSRDFCYWLQGYFEVSAQSESDNPELPKLDAKQLECVKNHLAMVFKHEIDPSMGDDKHQKDLSDLHGGLDRSPLFNC